MADDPKKHDSQSIRRLLYVAMTADESGSVDEEVGNFTNMPDKLIIVTKSRQRFIVRVTEE